MTTGRREAIGAALFVSSDSISHRSIVQIATISGVMRRWSSQLPSDSLDFLTGSLESL
jgi:hypothetical protein